MDIAEIGKVLSITYFFQFELKRLQNATDVNMLIEYY